MINSKRMTVRIDDAGSGEFGAKREGRLHLGVDLRYEPTEPVRAFFDAHVTRMVYPYTDTLTWQGLELVSKDRKWIMHILYVHPLVEVLRYDVVEGQIIGHAQDIRQRYPHLPKMTNHIHINLYANLTEFFR